MDFKKHTDLNFPHYAPPAVSAKEIDLLGWLTTRSDSRSTDVPIRHSDNSYILV